MKFHSNFQEVLGEIYKIILKCIQKREVPRYPSIRPANTFLKKKTEGTALPNMKPQFKVVSINTVLSCTRNQQIEKQNRKKQNTEITQH